jgi:hypothetical protein
MCAADAARLYRLVLIRALRLADHDLANFGARSGYRRAAMLCSRAGWRTLYESRRCAILDVLDGAGAFGVDQLWGPTSFAFAHTSDETARLAKSPGARQSLDIRVARRSIAAQIVAHVLTESDK